LAQAAPGSTGGTYGPINSQETFWSIASRLRPGPQVTIEQVQLAIYRANPQAFGNGSFNRLLQGSTLRVPSLAEMLKSPPAQALAAVSAWRQGRAPDIDKQTHQSDEAQANPVPASSPQPDNPKQAQPAKGVQPIEHAAAASPAAANPAPAQRAPKQIPAPVVTIPYQPAPAQAAQGQAGTAQGGGSSGSGNSQ
jgi:pilus assembly protein FimV